MNFKKDNSLMSAVAAIAGLAIGTALGVLLAPKSGKESRSFLADLINDPRQAQRSSSGTEIKEHLIEDVRAQVKETADHLTGDNGESIDPVKNTLKQTGPKSRQVPAEEV